MPDLPSSLQPSFPIGGGQTGELIRSMDWGAHPLGPPEDWPQSLRTTLSLLLSVQFPMFLFWGKAHFCFYNDAYWPNLAKYSPYQDAIGQAGETVWAHNWHLIKPVIDQILATGEPALVEDRLFAGETGGQGSVSYWTYSYSAVPDESGQPAGVLLTAFETTPKIVAHQQAEEKIRKSQALLSRTEATAHIGSYERIFATGELTVSDEMYRIFGYEPHSGPIPPDWLQTSVDEINTRTHPDDVHHINALIRQGEADGRAFTYVRRIYLPDGQIRHLFNQHEVIFDSEGKPLKMIGLTQDVTQQMLAQQQLQETARHLQMVLDSSPTAIAFLKPLQDEHQVVGDFQLVVCNQKFAQLTDRPIDQLVGLAVSALMRKLWQQNTVENIRGVLVTGEPFYNEQYDEPTDAWRLITLTRYDDGVVLNGQDITALKKAEQQQEYWLNQLEKSNESAEVLTQLRQQLRQRGELLRSSTHDLKGTFGIIHGSATLLDLVRTDEERERVLGMLQKSLDQSTQLIMQLLDYSRLEAGQEQVQLNPFDVAQLLRELATSVQPLVSRKKLRLQTKGLDSLWVNSDRVNVQRIVQNLLLNAIRYTEAGGITLTWSSGAADGYWSVVVEDTGSGLLPVQVNTLMDQPVESNESTVRSAGEGIGLMIVKWLVKLLGGHLRVESQLRVGTQFTIQLPGALAD